MGAPSTGDAEDAGMGDGAIDLAHFTHYGRLPPHSPSWRRLAFGSRDRTHSPVAQLFIEHARGGHPDGGGARARGIEIGAGPQRRLGTMP